MDALLTVLTSIFLIIAIIVAIRATKTSLALKKQQKENIEKKMSEYNASLHINLKNVTGLPLPANTMCDIFYGKDRIVIEGGGASFNLSMSKIFDVTVKTDVEIQKAIVSSVGGAVGGAVLFGPLGAMIGGSAQQRSVKNTVKYLIISYDKDGSIDYVSFETTNNPKSKEIEKAYNAQPKAAREIIEL